jgi:hypothetical protein
VVNRLVKQAATEALKRSVTPIALIGSARADDTTRLAPIVNARGIYDNDV